MGDTLPVRGSWCSVPAGRLVESGADLVDASLRMRSMLCGL